jgi:Zn-dependent protease
VLAMLAAAFVRLLPAVAGLTGGGQVDLAQPLRFLTLQAVEINLLLLLFNLIPIPPLDGGNVLSNLLPPRAAYRFDTAIRPYGFMLLLALMVSGLITKIIAPPFFFLATLLLP